MRAFPAATEPTAGSRGPAVPDREGGKVGRGTAGPAVRFAMTTGRRVKAHPTSTQGEEKGMLKFIGGTIGVIFLIGLLVVILLLSLIF